MPRKVSFEGCSSEIQGRQIDADEQLSAQINDSTLRLSKRQDPAYRFAAFFIHMVRLFIAIIFLSAVISCTDSNENKTEVTTNDSLEHLKQNKNSAQETATIADSIKFTRQKDSILLKLTEDILVGIKNKNYASVANFIHRSYGLRFSPYAFIDTVKHKKFSKEEFLDLANNANGKTIVWGWFDGSGEPIRMTLNAYMNRFVYDADFLKPEKRSVNKFVAGGNSLNNLSKIYPGCDFTESYFSGFDKKYEGMDWKTLRLVFKKSNDQFFLIGIVHDEWTI